MARLTTAERNALPDSEFAIPSQRKYPINDAAHAANAESRAAGTGRKNLSARMKDVIDSKANAVLGENPNGGS